jgi:hypothetical protein
MAHRWDVITERQDFPNNIPLFCAAEGPNFSWQTVLAQEEKLLHRALQGDE